MISVSFFVVVVAAAVCVVVVPSRLVVPLIQCANKTPDASVKPN